MDLTDTHVGVIRDSRNVWPKIIKLDGFTYDRWDGIAERSVEWFKTNWFVEKDRYHPQPYEQLAKVLKAAGQQEKARKILLSAKEREYELAENLFLDHVAGVDEMDNGLWV